MDEEAIHTHSGASAMKKNKAMIYKNLKKNIHVWTHTHMYIFSSSDSYIYMYTAAAAKSLQSCPTLCDPIDGSPPGSPIPGILQARTLEWVAISFSNICICIYLKLSQFAEHQKLRQHCELTVLQFKTKQNKKRKEMDEEDAQQC